MHLSDDRRIIPGETEATAREELNAILQEAIKAIPGARVEVEAATLIGLPLGARPDASARAGRGGGQRPLRRRRRTDGRGLRHRRLHPGRHGAADDRRRAGQHRAGTACDEFIDLAQLTAGARFYAALIGMPLPEPGA